VIAANGKASYAWSTSGVAAGTYYVAGYLWSGGKAYRSHLTSSFTIAVGAIPATTLSADVQAASWMYELSAAKRVDLLTTATDELEHRSRYDHSIDGLTAAALPLSLRHDATDQVLADYDV